ncbi:MAG: manganese efflux pump [Dehalococcoidales bacterium]|nr:manganese efflux pump [Dehalococcoidales bacterium]
MDELDIASITFIAFGLAADCFAVTISGSAVLKSFTLFQVMRTAFTFGLFQALMPVIGWLLGQTVVDIIADFDHWIAFGLLSIIGGKMIWESFGQGDDSKNPDFTRGFLLITLAIATSIDALAVGLTFAFLKVNIVMAVAVIGGIAFLATIVGFWLGKRLGKLAGRWAETLGGIILIGIGVRILISHLF